MTRCHATLTETLHVRCARLGRRLGSLYFEENGDARHRGKTVRTSKDGEGKAEHVLSAFCGGSGDGAFA